MTQPKQAAAVLLKLLGVAAGALVAFVWLYMSLAGSDTCSENNAGNCGSLTPMLGTTFAVVGVAGVIALLAACGLTLASLQPKARPRHIGVFCSVAAACMALQVVLIVGIRASRDLASEKPSTLAAADERIARAWFD
jgi:hypothetical protein